jgi:hypothetical protein
VSPAKNPRSRSIAATADLRSDLRGPNDVGERHRGKDSVQFCGAAGSGQELLHIVHERLGVL